MVRIRESCRHPGNVARGQGKLPEGLSVSWQFLQTATSIIMTNAINSISAVAHCDVRAAKSQRCVY